VVRVYNAFEAQTLAAEINSVATASAMQVHNTRCQ